MYFCPSTYVLIMGEFGTKDLDTVEELCGSDFTVFVAILVLYCNTKV